MTCVAVGSLIFLGFIVCCLPAGEGKITSPPDETEHIFLPGSSWNLTWTFDDAVSTLSTRTWTFESFDGLRRGNVGIIVSNLSPQKIEEVLSGIGVMKPATLELNKVTHSFDGNYTFTLATTAPKTYLSKVVVYIAKKPNVKLCRSGPITVIEGGDVTCKCCGEGGRPPANVTWSIKDDNQIGGIGKECKTLSLNNVNGTHNGTYKCEARSYVGDDYVDAKYIEVVVKPKLKPMKTTITIKPSQTTVGKEVKITCSSEGVPDPHFTIMHPNGTNITPTGNLYIIKNVQKSDNGTYTCIAINEIGEDTATGNLNVADHCHQYSCRTLKPTEIESTTLQPTTLITTTKDNRTGKGSSHDTTSKTEWYIVVVSFVSGTIFGILLCYIVWCSHRRWFRNRKPERNPELQTTDVDSTYHELDLTKMNKEDNYQSLTVNAASNDVGNEDDSTYTELNKIRDVENNYQSLT